MQQESWSMLARPPAVRPEAVPCQSQLRADAVRPNMSITIAIYRIAVSKDYSIAQAKQDLPAIVHEVERSGSARLTRRGQPVAVMLSIEEFERLRSVRRKSIEWSAPTLDTRGFQFDRDEANAR